METSARSAPIASRLGLGLAFLFAFALDGRLVWESSAGAGSHDWGSGASPILVDDLLVVNALGEEGEIFNGSPALVDGKLLIRSDRALYCVGR